LVLGAERWHGIEIVIAIEIEIGGARHSAFDPSPNT